MVSWAITGAALHWSREKKITADELADAGIDLRGLDGHALKVSFDNFYVY